MIDVYLLDYNSATLIDFSSPQYSITGIKGIDKLAITPKLKQSPGQRGGSVVNTSYTPRQITLYVEIAAATAAELWDYRQELLSKLYTSRFSITEPVQLAFHPTGAGYYYIDAVLTQSPEMKIISDNYCVVSIDFLCPFPFFRENTNDIVFTSPNSGMKFQSGVQELKFPFTMASNSVTVAHVNTGSADSYPKITIYGSCSYPFIKNVTTGEVLGITGSLDTNDFVVIETEYGKKSITVNRSGVVSDGFNLLDLSRSDFFPISPGTNNLEFGANIIEPGAHALVQYVRLYGGI